MRDFVFSYIQITTVISCNIIDFNNFNYEQERNVLFVQQIEQNFCLYDMTSTNFSSTLTV